MKILVIANANSEWIYNYLSLFQNCVIEPVLWSPYGFEQSYLDRYAQLGIRTISGSDSISEYLSHDDHTILKKLLFLMELIRSIRTISSICKWDVFNIQYVDPHLLRVFGFFPGISRRLVLSYWGSDLMRESATTLGAVSHIVSRSLGCTFDNEDLRLIHEKYYPGYHRRSIVMLPLPSLTDIDRAKNTINSEFVSIGSQSISRSRINICVGYNGNRHQQHDRVLRQLARLDNNTRQHISLLFPFTYSVDKEDSYIDDVKQQIGELGIENHIFESMLSSEDLARLRLVTDIFINAQTTDAFSGSICEVLYAGGRLINPKWLHYAEFDRYGLDYAEYTDFDELPDLIKNMVYGFTRSDDNSHNHTVIDRLRSVRSCSLAWKSYFLGLFSD